MQYLQKFKKQYNLGTQIAIIVGIILVVNFLSYQIFVRFDLTQNKIYSISKTTKQSLKELDDIINIKVYFSEQLPPQYISARQEVEDILKEYQNYANNKIKVEFIDPKDNKELQQELQMMGIPRLQFNILENDKYEIISGYLGMTISFEDNKQTIPVINDTGNLEYQLTSSIKKVIAEKTPVIGITSGHGEVSVEEMSIVDKKLKEIYKISNINLADTKKIDDNIDALLVVNPKEKFSEESKYAIDQFLMQGKSAVFLLEGITVNDNLTATSNENNLNSLLEKYGITIESYFVLDKSNEPASFTQGFMSFTTPYPFFVKVGQNGFNQDNASVAKLQSLILPWTSPLRIDFKNNSNIKVLAQTTKDAWLMRENFNLNPQGNFGFNPDPESYSLVVSRFGELTSAFDSAIGEEEYTNNSDNARIIVVGDSSFATDQFAGRYQDNLIFLQNIIDVVALDEDLINIRSKKASERPLKETSDGSKKIIRYLNVFGVTILVLAFGLIRYLLRKKSKFADDL